MLIKGVPDLKHGPSQSHPADEAHVFVLGATRVRFNVVRVGLTGQWTILPVYRKHSSQLNLDKVALEKGLPKKIDSTLCKVRFHCHHLLFGGLPVHLVPCLSRHDLQAAVWHLHTEAYI